MSPLEYNTFAEEVKTAKSECCLELFKEKKKTFQIKKEKTITKNLERIFDAALRISNRKSFHAMSMRDLSKEAELSIGALYNYFSGKKALLQMMQDEHRAVTKRFLAAAVPAAKTPLEQLRTALKTHLYLSETMQAWFYFSYMEAKNLDPDDREAAVQGELNTERLFSDILEKGKKDGTFTVPDPLMTAALIKAMLQDWYLKRSKYARRNISVDDYCLYLTKFIEKNIL